MSDENKPLGKFVLSDDELRSLVGTPAGVATSLPSPDVIRALEEVLAHLVEEVERAKRQIIALNQVLQTLVENQNVENLKREKLRAVGR